MNYASIKKCDIANGDGWRVTLFVSGCELKCKGCFNPEAQDHSFGNHFDELAKTKIFNELSKPYCSGLSILGGEPFSRCNDTRQTILELVREVKLSFPSKTIFMWSGYTIEQLQQDELSRLILENVDVLVDGPFIQELKDASLKWRGSSNQRILFL